jgi:hypothetical protein
MNTMRSRIKSNNNVIVLRQSIKRTVRNAPSVAWYDPACDSRHMAHVVTK